MKCAYALLHDFRPRWEKCSQYVEGGTERWNELSQNRTSDELVDVLLAEMTGQDIALIQAGASTGAEYFEGQVTMKPRHPPPPPNTHARTHAYTDTGASIGMGTLKVVSRKLPKQQKIERFLLSVTRVI